MFGRSPFPNGWELWVAPYIFFVELFTLFRSVQVRRRECKADKIAPRSNLHPNAWEGSLWLPQRGLYSPPGRSCGQESCSRGTPGGADGASAVPRAAAPAAGDVKRSNQPIAATNPMPAATGVHVLHTLHKRVLSMSRDVRRHLTTGADDVGAPKSCAAAALVGSVKILARSWRRCCEDGAPRSAA